LTGTAGSNQGIAALHPFSELRVQNAIRANRGGSYAVFGASQKCVTNGQPADTIELND
jgi:hypothetical protein